MGFKQFSPRDVEGMTNRLVICTRAEDHDEAFLGGTDGDLCEFAARAFSASAELIAQNHKGETKALNTAYRFAGAGRIALEVFARRIERRGGPITPPVPTII